jgi:septum formation inhibitor MinC
MSNVETIKIVIHTNVENQKEVVLTRDLLLPNVNAESIYPYFTYVRKYDESKLNSLSYEDKVKFFFNKPYFIKILGLPAGSSGQYRENDDLDAQNKNKSLIMENNVTVMLRLLFPTNFPVVNDVKQSIDIVLNRKSHFSGMVYNPLNPPPNAYLKIGGKTYTVQNVTWLNDFLNHPKYNELMVNYVSFYDTIREEGIRKNESLEKEMADKTKDETYNKVVSLYKEIYFDDPEEDNNAISFFRKSYENNRGFKVEETDKQIKNVLVNAKETRAYKEFNDFLKKYRHPKRTTSNWELQHLIDATNDKDTKRFYDFMRGVRGKYEYNSEIVYTDTYMNVGVCNIERSGSLPKLEIYVLINLFEGELNAENTKDIACSFNNLNIGNKLDTLWGSSGSMNWNVKENPFLYKIKNNVAVNATNTGSKQQTSVSYSSDNTRNLTSDTNNEKFAEKLKTYYENITNNENDKITGAVNYIKQIDPKLGDKLEYNVFYLFAVTRDYANVLSLLQRVSDVNQIDKKLKKELAATEEFYRTNKNTFDIELIAKQSEQEKTEKTEKEIAKLKIKIQFHEIIITLIRVFKSSKETSGGGVTRKKKRNKKTKRRKTVRSGRQ